MATDKKNKRYRTVFLVKKVYWESSSILKMSEVNECELEPLKQISKGNAYYQHILFSKFKFRPERSMF